ncbi:MAG: twin-arginine translocase subunit TatC [Candidatus Omnitrophica bacterium]|nr:twin-arginine translocase subunit TatC [Candidatus Omnitrophota bacterium]
MLQSPQFLSFFSHLHELRDRLIKSLAAFVVCTVVVWNFLDPVIRFVVRPVGRIVFTSPVEAFNGRMTLAMTGGFLFALPVILYHFWKFISLGLTVKEQRYVRIFGPLSLAFFFLGVVFGYFVMLPISITFLLSFSSAWMVPMITVDKYISFVGTIVIASGVTFELPLILAFLARIGIATPEFLRQKRRYAIIMILITAAILTPPDVISQIILSIPLLVLYETGIFFARWAESQRDA